MAQVQNKYAQIISDIKKGIFKPIYFLMGDEPYYIDLITDAIIENALEESERDFNQTILYGLETEISSLINGAKRYPMMSQRQLIVVKEAQYLEKIEDLIYYVEDYQPLTVLVVNYKEGLIKDKKLISAIEKI
ncbi:MAG: DNA polymerase III subunit delta, partial [Bacteroidales bacterium]